MESDRNSDAKVETQMLRRSKRKKEAQAVYEDSSKLSKKEKPIEVFLTDQEKQDITCSVCSKQYSRIDNLVAHHRALHSGTVIECDVCFKQFSSDQGLRRHQVTHSEDRPYCCSMCSKSFKRADTLATHEETHFQSPAFKCEQCSEVLGSKKSLERHVRSVHESRDENKWPHLCSVCRCSFPRLDTLRKHEKKHDGYSSANRMHYDVNGVWHP